MAVLNHLYAGALELYLSDPRVSAGDDNIDHLVYDLKHFIDGQTSTADVDEDIRSYKHRLHLLNEELWCKSADRERVVDLRPGRIGICSPPRRAEYMLWFLPRQQRDDVLGDLSEDYLLVLERFGERKANLWYWGKVLLEVGPFLREHIFTTWLGELIKQFRSK